MIKNNLKYLILIFIILLYSRSEAQNFEESYKKGEELYTSQSFQEAIPLFTKAIGELQKSGNDSLIRYNYYYLGMSYYYSADYNSALDVFKTLHNIELKSERSDFLSLSYSNLGLVYMSLQDYEHARENYEESIRLCKKDDNDQYLMYAYYNLGIIYHNNMDLEKAAKYYIKAADIFEVSGGEAYASNLTYTVGQIKQYYQDYNEAAKYYSRSAEIDLKRNDPENASAKIHNTGQMYMDIGKPGKAVEYFSKSIEIYKQAGLNEELGTLYYHLAYAYNELNDNNKYTILDTAMYYDRQKKNDTLLADKLNTKGYWLNLEGRNKEAVICYKNALMFEDKLTDNPDLILTIIRNMAIAYQEGFEYRNSISYNNLLIRKDSEISDSSLAILYNAIGYCYMQMTVTDTSLNYFEKAVKINSENNFEDNLAVNYNNIGLNYRNRGLYSKSIDYHFKAKEIYERRNELNELPTVLNNAGVSLQKMGKQEEAKSMFEKAEKIARQYNDEDAVAISMNNIGLVYYNKGDYNKSIEYFEQSLAHMNKKGLVTKKISNLTNLGLSYYNISAYETAFDYFSEALKLAEEYEINSSIINAQNDLGMLYNAWGKNQEALNQYQEALKLAQKLDLQQDISVAYNNIGYLYSCWNDYKKAEEYYKKSIQIDQESGSTILLAQKFGNLGGLNFINENYDEARKNFNKAMELATETGVESYISQNLNNLGNLESTSGNYDKALEYYKKSLELEKKSGREADQAMCYANIASIYVAQGKSDKALEYFYKTLEIRRRLNMKAEIASSLTYVAMLTMDNGEYAKAIEYYNEAIDILEELRKDAPMDVRREYFQQMLDNYYSLAFCYFIEKDIQSAFEIIENSKAKTLYEQIKSASDTTFEDITFDNNSLIGKNTAVFFHGGMNRSQIPAISLTTDSALPYILNKQYLIDTLVNIQKLGIKEKVLKGLNEEQKLHANLYFEGKSMDYYTYETAENAIFENIIEQYRSRLMEPYPKDPEATKIFASVLYRFFVEPFEFNIKGKRNLLIMTDGILGLIPFETLIDNDGKYLVENYDIGYIQSFHILKILKQRIFDNERKEMLAFGGAVYNELTYKEDMAQALTKTENNSRGAFSRLDEEKIDKIRNFAIKDLEENSTLSTTYRLLGLNHWNNLSGSLSEVSNIASIVPGTDTITGDKVTERVFKNLSADGKLKDYKCIHFSLHGMTVPEIPELTALVFSQIADSAKEDNFLRMNEISKLSLSADFVNLSACETGLGKVYYGEGVVGLAQSFLIAGTNSINVSLWQVADQSTAVYMSEMYKLVHQEDYTYFRAINEMKRKFIKGEYDKWWVSPFFWAPFIYYGPIPAAEL